MRLRITTPLSIVVDEDPVISLRAEDASGGFGVMPGHADFLTSLAVSVVRWVAADGKQRYCAVRGGMMTVSGGNAVAIATREAVCGDDLATLDQDILRRFRTDLDTQRVEQIESARLQLNAVRQLMRHLRPHGPVGTGNFQ